VRNLTRGPDSRGKIDSNRDKHKKVNLNEDCQKMNEQMKQRLIHIARKVKEQGGIVLSAAMLVQKCT
jgi:hypothetical protein